MNKVGTKPVGRLYEIQSWSLRYHRTYLGRTEARQGDPQAKGTQEADGEVEWQTVFSFSLRDSSDYFSRIRRIAAHDFVENYTRIHHVGNGKWCKKVQHEEVDNSCSTYYIALSYQ